MSRRPKNRAIADNWRGLYGRDPISSTLPDASSAVLLGNGETDPNRAQIIAAAALQGERIGVDPRTMGNGEEVRPLP